MERRIVGGESPNRTRRWVLGREADRHPAQAVHEPSKSGETGRLLRCRDRRPTARSHPAGRNPHIHPIPQATSATSPLVGDHRGAAEVRGIDRSQGRTPPSRYRLAKDRLADLMATTTELGLTKPTSTAFWYSRPLTGTVEVFDRFVPTGTGAAKVQWYYRM